MAASKKGKRRAAPRQKLNASDVVDFGNRIWLAGLGAVARAQTEGPKLFDSLVEDGREMQEHTLDVTTRAFNKTVAEIRGATDERLSAIRGKASDTWENVEKIFQARVQKALQQLGMPTSQEIRTLTRKVDELTRSVEGLGTKSKRSSRSMHSSSSAHSANA